MENNDQLAKTDAGSQLQGAKSNDGRSAVRAAVDIFEDSLGVKVLADVPGVSKEGLDVRVHDSNLYIEAVPTIELTAGMKLHHAELLPGRFSRSFTLSPDFDPSKIDATLKDGVLTVSIPRREEAKPRRIEVQVG